MEEILRQLNTADQSAWAESRARTILMYWPDCLPTPTNQLCSIVAIIVFHTPPSHTLYINLLLYDLSSGLVCLCMSGCRFKWLLALLKQLHKLNFRLISYEANMVYGRTDGYYQLFEVVFKKDNVWNYLDTPSPA